jgi:lysophospholipase L1-like esterase
MAEQLNKWFPKDHNSNISLLGGELTLIPYYPELLKALCRRVNQAGLITNGVFAKHKKTLDKFIDAIKKLNVNRFTIRVSQSQYHSQELYGTTAYDILASEFATYDNIYVQYSSELTTLVPFGRAFDLNTDPDNWIIGAMCESALDNNVFVDEKGFVHLCPMGNSPHKHFSEDNYRFIRRELMDWRASKITKGMDCISCSKSGIGSLNPNPSFVKTEHRCTQGGFNGAL